MRVDSRALVVLAAAMAWALPAHAWGPLTHIDYNLGALSSLALLGEPMRKLLRKHGRDFLYGGLAADLVLGKNLARYIHHVHNWRVVFALRDEAARRGPAQEAFTWGMLCHLAADTVAHNYYVPYKVVESFDQRATKHGYWELRFDSTREPEVWRVAREISVQEIRAHDWLLEELLVGQRLPFGLNRRIFSSVLMAVRIKSWKQMVAVAVRRRREHALTSEQVSECERLVHDAILGLLIDGEAARCLRADPTGLRNLRVASELRRKLSRMVREKTLSPGEAHTLAAHMRPAFREAIYGKLVVPALG